MLIELPFRSVTFRPRGIEPRLFRLDHYNESLDSLADLFLLSEPNWCSTIRNDDFAFRPARPKEERAHTTQLDLSHSAPDVDVPFCRRRSLRHPTLLNRLLCLSRGVTSAVVRGDVD